MLIKLCFYVCSVKGETEIGSAGEQPIRDALGGSTKCFFNESSQGGSLIFSRTVMFSINNCFKIDKEKGEQFQLTLQSLDCKFTKTGFKWRYFNNNVRYERELRYDSLSLYKLYDGIKGVFDICGESKTCEILETTFSHPLKPIFEEMPEALTKFLANFSDSLKLNGVENIAILTQYYSPSAVKILLLWEENDVKVELLDYYSYTDKRTYHRKDVLDIHDRVVFKEFFDADIEFFQPLAGDRIHSHAHYLNFIILKRDSQRILKFNSDCIPYIKEHQSQYALLYKMVLLARG